MNPSDIEFAFGMRLPGEPAMAKLAQLVARYHKALPPTTWLNDPPVPPDIPEVQIRVAAAAERGSYRGPVEVSIGTMTAVGDTVDGCVATRVSIYVAEAEREAADRTIGEQA